MGGIVLHEGDIAEMKTGEGKTFVATQPLFLNCARRDGRAPRDGQRLPRQARRRVDALRLRAPRHHRRAHREHDAVRRAPRGLRVRHHVRHELRVRLRLPARQHGGVARGRRAARPLVRDRGRGRLDPDRRGAHAADHLRRAGDGREGLLRLRARRQDVRRRSRRTPSSEGRRSPTPTTSSTRSTRRSRRPRSAIEKIERVLRIDNLYDPRNVQLVNHLIAGAEGASRCTSATSTTSCRTAR